MRRGLTAMAIGTAVLAMVSLTHAGPGDVQQPASSPDHGRVMFVDLDRAAKETGLDFQYQANLAAARGDLEQRLRLARERLSEEARGLQARFAATTQPEQRAQIQQQFQAKERELAAMANSLQTELTQFNQKMQTQFRVQLQPALKKISEAHGDAAVLVRDVGVGYAPPELDLTDALIAELRANPIKLPTTQPE